MGKFSWRKKKIEQRLLQEENASIRDDNSLDISALPSPNLDTMNGKYYSITSESDAHEIPESSENLVKHSHPSRAQRLGRPNLEISIGSTSSAREPTFLESPVKPISSEAPAAPPPGNAAEWAAWAFEQEMRKGSPQHGNELPSPSVRSGDSHEDEVPQAVEQEATISGCTAHYDNYSYGWSCIYITMLFVTVYASIFSGIWLGLAFWEPNWGGIIGKHGMSLSTATLLTSINSKIIEVASLSMFGMFLGQLISRRAISVRSGGISLAVLNIRLWITRPGVILTHFRSVIYAAKTRPFLALIAILTALAGFLYTPASNALISPKLTYGLPERRSLYGPVEASYANPLYIEASCKTPITELQDPQNAASTCVAMEHVGQAYYNYLGYIQKWADLDKHSGTDGDLAQRPQATAQLYSNTSVQGTWIYPGYSNMEPLYVQHDQRVINNITLAMPHPGVLTAARDQKNGIAQPADFGGTGEYLIRAAVPSPALNVLCANVAPKEIAPLVYTQWPHAKTMSSSIPGWRQPESPFWTEAVPRYADNEWLNRTAVDDLFGWGEKYGRRPPVFEVLPIDYNTVVNESIYYGDSTYILLKSHATTNYTVCSMRSFLYPNCSTDYRVSGTISGSLQTSCDDPKSELEYRSVVPDAPITLSVDYPNVASEWALATSLNDGTVAGNASNARLLTELIPLSPWYDDLLPSVAEAIAVLAGSTLLLAAMGTPFVHYWGYNETMLPNSVYEPFTATVATSQYKSIHTEGWQACFYTSLIWTFLASLFVTFYFLRNRRLVTDYTESENIFALGVNSPPSDTLNGACGPGPSGSMLAAPFWVAKEESNNHYYFKIPQNPGDNETVGKDDDMELGSVRSRFASVYSFASFRTKEEQSFV